MPKRKRVVHERTEDWTELQRRLKWPEQVIYELIRPVVVFGETASERACNRCPPADHRSEG